MPYTLADETYPSKDAVSDRCRAILAATPNGESVAEAHATFLFELFQFHDEWEAKASGGVRAITTQSTPHGTRCFALVRHDETTVDISFPHAVRLMPSVRSSKLQPQGLRDFRSAARVAVQPDIHAFRDRTLATGSTCPITGEQLTRFNCAVDHQAPLTFDQLLFDFCRAQSINPLEARVMSHDGTVAAFEDEVLAQAWQQHHLRDARLRLISRVANLRLEKPKVPWHEVCQ